MKTTVVLPTYNEAQNIEALTAALLELPLDDLVIIIVDDDSPDGTGHLADELAAGQPERVQVLHRVDRRGLGSAYVEGFNRALQTGAQVVIQMDADFSHAPRYIPEMLATLNDCDVVIGSRYVAGGRLDEHWGWGRRLLSLFANSVYTRSILGLQVRDATAGFRAWKRETLLGLGLQRVRSNGYVFQVELTYLTERLGYLAHEFPIYFKDRRIGRSKMSQLNILEAVWRTPLVAYTHRRLTPADRQR
ncbi:MAG TPA: polyprenol monophosphomannose synthase [Anaerolineales bacterium]|jgi:dolichol-phosphate mannosyltransferase|nr:polyprenol monophosphomannose synthase [Anaerolineaceae bacterium]HJO34243.1 polyprenol monophosphomannose synthase [Anaerolineales bacterium]|tara:strand:- start:272 stop:1012 length:741 start_codon:yes stop_codon:yes gene_type:complete